MKALTTIQPIARYPGSKWKLATWITSHFPSHRCYLEPFFGSGAILFSKPIAGMETVNDLDVDVYNLFRIVRTRGTELAAMIEMTPWSRDEFQLSYDRSDNDDPLERARKFLVRIWQGHGCKFASRNGWHFDTNGRRAPAAQWTHLPARILNTVERLRGVHIDNLDARELIPKHNLTDVLIYADPPYLMSVRSHGNCYANEFKTDADHLELLEILDRHRGPVLVSGYASELYDTRLTHWHRVTHCATAEHGRAREEVLWINPTAAARLHPTLLLE